MYALFSYKKGKSAKLETNVHSLTNTKLIYLSLIQADMVLYKLL